MMAKTRLSRFAWISAFLCCHLFPVTCNLLLAQQTQPTAADYTATSITLILQNPPKAVPSSNIGARRLDNPGACSYYYWVVAKYLVGNAQPSGPAAITDATCGTLSNGNRINWSFVTGATSYDVLATTTPNPPQGTGNFAVATGNTSGTVTDTGTRNAYTVITFDPATLSCRMTNVPTGAGTSQAQLTCGSLAPIPVGGSPAPPNTSVQFNCAGSFCGDAAFTWDQINKELNINTSIIGNGNAFINENISQNITEDPTESSSFAEGEDIQVTGQGHQDGSNTGLSLLGLRALVTANGDAIFTNNFTGISAIVNHTPSAAGTFNGELHGLESTIQDVGSSATSVAKGLVIQVLGTGIDTGYGIDLPGTVAGATNSYAIHIGAQTPGRYGIKQEGQTRWVLGDDSGAGSFVKLIGAAGQGIIAENDAIGGTVNSQIFPEGQFKFQNSSGTRTWDVDNLAANGQTTFDVENSAGPAQGATIVVRSVAGGSTGLVIDEQGTGNFVHEAIQIIAPTGGGSNLDIGSLDSTLTTELGFLAQLSNQARTQAFSFQGSVNPTATKGVAFLATDNIAAPANGNAGFYQSGTSSGLFNHYDAPSELSAASFTGRTITSSGNLATTDFMIRCDATAGAVTVTLPASPARNQFINVKKIDASANNCVVAGNGHNIDGAASQTTNVQNRNFQLQYESTSGTWNIL